MLEQFAQFLKTVPASTGTPKFSELVIRAVNPSETLVIERDLRARPLEAEEVVELAREHLHSDSAYEVGSHWDLWTYDAETRHWKFGPQRLELHCRGEEYDDGAYVEGGHFQAEIAFEHLFTGHGRLLGARAGIVAPPEHPAEVEFLAAMSRAENLREYHQKTRENIQKLLGWIGALEEALPIERYRLWSEGEENFEARLDEILAVR